MTPLSPSAATNTGGPTPLASARPVPAPPFRPAPPIYPRLEVMKPNDDAPADPHHFWTHFWCGLVFGGLIGAYLGNHLFNQPALVWGSACAIALLIAYGCGRWGDVVWHLLLQWLWWLR